MIAFRLAALIGLLTLAGCASTQTAQYASQPIYTNAPVDTAALPPSTNPAQQNAEAMAQTDVASFIDPQAAALLSANSRNQAAGAQYNALQFGRPGAPRNWQGDSGQSGAVVVGPYIRVNAIDCREFTHTVTVAGQSYVKKGTACREPTGRWSTVSATG
jgi:surface antigen